MFRYFLTLCLLALTTTALQSAQPVFWIDFDDPDSPHAQRLDGMPTLEIVPGVGVDGSHGLRAAYEPFEQGTRRMVSKMPIPPALEYTLCYDVQFEEDFQFTGGKLHGLGPRRTVTGGQNLNPAGWSARANFTRRESTTSYNYHQDQPGKYGASATVHDREFRFERGKYHAVSLHVRLNENPEEATGFSRVYVDGNLIASLEDVRYRGTDDADSLIQLFLFSTFHGGSTERWTPKDEDGNWVTVHALFDNFAVYPGEYVRESPGEGMPGRK